MDADEICVNDFMREYHRVLARIDDTPGPEGLVAARGELMSADRDSVYGYHIRSKNFERYRRGLAVAKQVVDALHRHPGAHGRSFANYLLARLLRQLDPPMKARLELCVLAYGHSMYCELFTIVQVTDKGDCVWIDAFPQPDDDMRQSIDNAILMPDVTAYERFAGVSPMRLMFQLFVRHGDEQSQIAWKTDPARAWQSANAETRALALELLPTFADEFPRL